MFPPKADEFPFPLGRVDLANAPSLPPSFAPALDKSIEEIALWLAQSAASIKSPAVLQVRESVLQYRPTSLVYLAERWLIKLVRDDDRYPVRHGLLFQAPPATDNLRAALDRFGIEAQGAIPEFFEYFPGLRHVHSNAFKPPTDWVPFKSFYYYGHEDGLDPTGEWADAAVIYSDCSGNIILMKSSGEITWVDHEAEGPEMLIPFRSSFEDFLSELAISLNRGHFPVYGYPWPG